MKKLFVFAYSILLCGSFATAQDNAWQVKEGNVMTYHVKSNGQEYNFGVTVKQLSPQSANPIIFDWNMTDPINKSGTIKISSTAAKSSNSLYNWFSGGEKLLEYETSVFVSDYLNTLLRAMPRGMTVKIKAHGLSFGDQTFMVEDAAQDFSFMKNNVKETIKVIALKDLSNGEELKIYCSPQNAFIVSMSIGFDIALESVSSK